MSIDPEIILEVARNTEVLRLPKQVLATFGVTAITYYLLTEPVYAELEEQTSETVVRKGKVTAERPQIVTPYYLLSLFRGFEHGQEYAQYLLNMHGAHSPALLYSYHNELQETSIVSEPPKVVAGRLNDQLEKDGEALSAIIQGVDHLWDISLMKFIYELTLQSLGQNVGELGQRGLLSADRGLPRAARIRIDEMFTAVERGGMPAQELKAELDRWGVFGEYEDRFLGLFRRK
ncbi:MAG: hypothetical protein HYY30_14160 [Chloroflexi bacterium]|nr:hypothetical protein [Chloroflexota bacterium]